MKTSQFYATALFTLFLCALSTACSSKEELPTPPPPPPPATLESLHIETPPAKTTYTLDEVLSLEGLKVVGTYSDGKTRTIEIKSENTSGFSSEKPAETQQVNISVEKKTASFPVQILPMRVTDGVLTEVLDGYPEIQLPKGVKSIQNGLFLGKNIQRVTLNDGLEAIGEKAFLNSKIEEINFPASLKTIGKYAFYMCTKLTRLDLSQTQIVVIEDSTFGLTGIKELKLPATLTDIKVQAFINTAALELLTIPSSVKNIETEAFRECGITTLNLPNSITLVGTRAFYYSPNLVEVKTYGPTSTDNLSAVIKEACFTGCDALTVFNIPQSIRTLEQGIIGNNQNVVHVTIPFQVTKMHFSVFGNTAIKEVIVEAINPPETVLAFDVAWVGFPNDVISITVPSGSVEQYKVAKGWKEYATKIH